MKILMVCLGNICRSPMAEGIMRRLAFMDDLSLEVDSVGTAAYHVGEAPDARMQYIGRTRGVDISQLKARAFEIEDFDRFDHILVMDRENYSNIIRQARNAEDKHKVELIMSYLDANSIAEVPDPYYGGDEGFEKVFEILEQSCKAFIKTHFRKG